MQFYRYLRGDSSIQIYIFTNTPLRLKKKYGRLLEALEDRYGIYYFIIESFKDFQRAFLANIEFRINKKNWLPDPYLRMCIIPTLTFKAYFINDFKSISNSELQVPVLMKMNISNKLNKSVHTYNRAERKFDHLNNCDDLKTSHRNNYDRWPIPDYEIYSEQVENMSQRSWTQSILINKNRVDWIENSLLDDNDGKLLSSLFDNSERQIPPTNIPEIYDHYHIIDTKFLKHLGKIGLFSEEWATSLNTKDCRPLYYECSIYGQTQSDSFGMIVIYRK